MVNVIILTTLLGFTTCSYSVTLREMTCFCQDGMLNSGHKMAAGAKLSETGKHKSNLNLVRSYCRVYTNNRKPI